MKTIKETIEKWNEMYDFVLTGATGVNNMLWQRVKDVFGIKDYPADVITDFRSAWNELSQEDAEEDEKVWPLITKCIEGLLSKSPLTDYAFYLYKGEIGILCEIDAEVIKAKGYESFDGVAFIPGDDMREVLADKLNDEPLLCNDDAYSQYCGLSEIILTECRCMENEEHTELNWWSKAWSESDEFNRMFGKDGEFTCKLREQLESGEIDEAEARNEWENEKKNYSDPLGCTDYSFDAIFK